MIETLAYVGIASPNVDAWADFGPKILGLQAEARGTDGALPFRMDDAAQRLVIHPADNNDVAYLGWEVAGPAALAAAATTLEQQGLTVRRAAADEVAARAVADLVWFIDPFGFRHELVWGLTMRPGTFRPGRPMSGFVTGGGGLGHVVLILPDQQRAERFYIDVMGLRLSDRIEAGISLRFLHCNQRHHTLAFASIPGMVGLHHIMLEVASLDDVGTAFDLCGEHDVPIAMGLGRHTNDLMTSFYARSPSGFEIEYGWGGKLVDDRDWVVGSFDAMSIWGHKRPETPLPPGLLRPFR